MRRPPFLRLAGRLLPLAGLALLAPTRAIAADAEPAPVTVAVPKVEGLVVDGTPSEAGWAQAARLPVETAPPVGSQGPPPPACTVRLATAAGRLLVAVEVAEAAGFPVGLRGFVAAEGTASIVDAAMFAYMPMDARAPRFIARGPAGEGRSHYRVTGAFDATRRGAWSLEVAIPLDDLRLPSATTGLRAAFSVALRTPNAMVGAPPGAVFASLDAFARLTPPEGGWPAAPDDDAASAERSAALAEEDRLDRLRLGRWSAFVAAFTAALREGAGDREAVLAPLLGAIEARPDLAILRLAKGEALERFGDLPGAEAAYREALSLAPHLPEARWALAQRAVAALVEPSDDTPSDYEAALARVAARREAEGGDDPAAALAEAVLRYRLGDFPAAAARFDEVLPLYPVGDDTLAMAAASRRYPEAFAQELSMRRRDEGSTLPRARLTTSRGEVVVELFQDDAPNSVANFVYLADARFYDGLAFHRVVPFFMAQTGDPYSRGEPAPGVAEDERVGRGGPGYAIPTEAGKRRPFRGVLAMARRARDTEGSQFFLTTGTSAHLEGEYTIFGRVVEGQDVVDRIVRGDRLIKVEVLRRRPGPYHPTTVAGTPAPRPAPAASR